MDKFFRKFGKYFAIGIMVLFLSACRPNVATPTVECDRDLKECLVTVKNNENKTIGLEVKTGYEAYGSSIGEETRNPGGVPPAIHDKWVRNPTNFFKTHVFLNAGQEITFKAVIPESFYENPGYSLFVASVRTDPPNAMSISYGDYYAYDNFIIPGIADFPVEYELKCEGNKAFIHIKNNGEWGDRTFGVYRNEELDSAWQEFTVKSGESIWVETNPFPAGTYLIEVDVLGHQEATNDPDNPVTSFHDSRGYCIPGKPEKLLDVELDYSWLHYK